MARPWVEAGSAWEELARALAARLAEDRGPAPLRAEPFEPLEGGWALGAVDGGSAVVLEGHGLAVGAVRVAALAWRSRVSWLERPAPLELRLLDEDLALDLDERLPGLPQARGPEHLAERLRCLREWEASMALAGELGQGDVLALDGSLAQREGPASLQGRLAEACRRRGVHLAGFCKSTTTTVRGSPLPLAASRSARGVPEPWLAVIPGLGPARACAVRFLAGARVFKVELPPGEEPSEVLGKLAPWTRDAGYPGYPYPLALAHNRCALDEALVEDLAHALRGLALKQGAAPGAWEDVFGDFHDVLDRGL